MGGRQEYQYSMPRIQTYKHQPTAELPSILESFSILRWSVACGAAESFRPPTRQNNSSDTPWPFASPTHRFLQADYPYDNSYLQADLGWVSKKILSLSLRCALSVPSFSNPVPAHRPATLLQLW